MDRRQATVLVLGSGVAFPFAAIRAATTARIGFITAGSRAAAQFFIDSFLSDLAARGYASGSVELESRFADDMLDRIPGLVSELERLKVQLIVTHAAATSIVVKGSHGVPVVYEFSADPTTVGIADDLRHPLFNATGITLMLAELNGKRLELAQQMLPRMRRVAVLANVLHPGHELERAVAEEKARRLGITVSMISTRSEAELDAGLSALAADVPDALLVLSDGFVVQHRRKILDFAASRRLPVISGWAVMADDGALCTYGPRLAESYRRVGYFVDRILKGAKVTDLPIEQPTLLELVVNARTAQRLGIVIPAAILARADRILE